MKPAPFDYHAPASAKELVDLLAELGDSAKVIAGGQSLVPMLALRLTAFEHLIDIRNVGGLRGIERRGQAIWIGAGTTQSTIGRSLLVAGTIPLLARATPLIGHFQVRNRGTIGGSLAHADAAAEYPAVALALDAEMQTLSPRGQRTIPAAEFFTGIWSTALEPDELLTGVAFTPWGPRSGFAIEEFARRPGDFAVAGAAVAVELGPDKAVTRCAISLFGLGPTPLRAFAGGSGGSSPRGSRAAEAIPTDRGRSASEIGQAAVADLTEVPSDLHGPAAYRKRVGAAMVARAWTRATEEALSA